MYRDLLRVLPRVKSAELIERLSGVDRLRDHFEPLDEDEDELAPF